MEDITGDKIQYLRENLPFYTENYIRVRPKDGGPTVPFKFNNAQVMLHSFIEDLKASGQLVKIGRASCRERV